MQLFFIENILGGLGGDIFRRQSKRFPKQRKRRDALTPLRQLRQHKVYMRFARCIDPRSLKYYYIVS